MGRVENIVKAPEKPIGGLVDGMGENARELARQGLLGNAVKMIQTGLRAPADVKSRMDVLFGVVHDVGQFVPVVHLFKGELFHRRARNDHAVEGTVAYLRKGLVETLKMLRRGVFRLVALRPQERDVDLQRRVAEQTQKLCFRGDLGRHQVDNGDFERADVLTVGPPFRHDENVFALQNRAGGEVFGNLDGHGALLAKIQIQRFPTQVL